MEPKRQFLKDYQAPAFAVNQISLDFNIFDDHVLVKNIMQIQSLQNAPLELNGQDFELVSISLNSRKLDAREYLQTTETLTVLETPVEFQLEVVTRLKPQENTSLEGLYISDGILCTQCEAQGFRKITYYLDRPDIMTSFKVRIEAEKNKFPILLSNGDRLQAKTLTAGRHEVLWHDPFKKPCYLFALVAGDLGLLQEEFVTLTGKKVQLEIYASHGQQNRCHHAMESLKKSMQWDESRFGREYDLSRYMIVAIDNFNAGAMENKGLNIFNSRLVLADAKIATDTDYSAIESVIAHEYFHNWTGNRVTLRDWFQLSLKEGLTVFRDQEFSADMSDRGLQRMSDVHSLRERQFPEDAGSNAHPVRPESCLSVDNFFTATIYEKGAELIRMMQILTGRNGFRMGMDNYFKKFDGHAVTTDDFANAIGEVNDLDLTQFKLWYQQAGTPQISVHEHYNPENHTYDLTLSQKTRTTSGSPAPQPFHIPVLFGLLDQSGEEINLKGQNVTFNSDGEPVLQFTQERQTFRFSNLSQKPTPSLFREFSAPIQLHWEAPLSESLLLMRKDRDGFNRRETAQKVFQHTLEKIILQNSTDAIPNELVICIKEILKDAKMDLGFKAQMITLPTDMTMAQVMPVFNAAKVRHARFALQQQLAQHCEKEFAEIYSALNQGSHLTAMTTLAFGARELKNKALSFLKNLNHSEYNLWIESQYFAAQNMTDRMSAMKLLVDSQIPAREKALNHFLNEFQNNSLVLNKWFQVQAVSNQDNVFSEVQKLVVHPQFQINNPNHVYSLLRNFGDNISMFHDLNLGAYEFYVSKLEAIDQKNPQVAARLCATFNIFEKLPQENQFILSSLLKNVLSKTSLSKNTRELLQSLPLR